MEHAVKAQITDTPESWMYAEYDRRKADIWRESETLDEHHASLAELIEELGL